MRLRAWLAYLGLGALVVVAHLAVPVAGARAVLFDAAPGLAALAIALGIVLHRPPTVRAWALAAAGIVLTGVGNVVYDVERRLNDAEPGFPSAADVLFLGGYAFFLVAMFLYVRDEERRTRWRGILDAVIVSAGAALLVWSSLPKPADGDGTLVPGLVAAAYPTADALLLVVVVSLLFSETRPFTSSDGLLVSSIALLLGTDVLHAQLAAHGAYANGSPVDAGWIGAFLLAGAAGLHPSAGRRGLRETGGRLASFRFAITAIGMIAPAIALVRASLTDDHGMSLAAAALTVLVLVRAVDLLHRNARLRRVAEHERSLLRATLDATADGILVIDGDGGVTAYNDQFARIWGLPESVFAERNRTRGRDLAMSHVADSDAFIARIREIETDPLAESNDQLELTDGRVVLRHSKPQILGGEVVGRVWSFRDVTDVAAAERMVRESARRFQEALENVPLAAVALDLRDRIAFVNDFLLDLTGWSRDEVLGRRWRDVFTPPDEESLRMNDEWEQGLTAGEPPPSQEARLLTRDGRVRLVSWANTPLHGADGAVNGVACVGEDITDRRLAEEALRRSEERFRALTENALEVVTVISATGTILYESPSIERLFGFTPEELVGRNAFEFVHPDDFEANQAKLADLLADPGGMREYEMRGLHKDGSYRWISGFARNLVDNPAIGGIVVNFRDVTELRQSQEQLLHAQKLEAVGQLAGGVAHDFNNLLTAIRGYAELMLMQLPPGDPLRTDAEEIARAGERAAALTRQLLAFSRRQMLQPTVLEVNAVVGEIENLLRRLIGEDVELVTVLDPACCRVKADPGQLEQVLVNLAVNARDAMPEGGRLTIETGYSWLAEGEHGLRGGAYAMLSVADTGSRMSEEILSHLFEPFFTTKERGKGTGLGLATVYGIVKQSEGDVVVESTPGDGSRFTVYLPRVAEPAATNGDSPLTSTDGAGSETVLLVEDEALVRALARRVLEDQGYLVLEAAEAAAALELCAVHEGSIDLLLTDVVMPRMSGRELAERLVSLRPETRVLYTSGYNEEAIGQHGVTDLGGAFLSKPFTPSTLARKVREVLDSVGERA